MRRTRASMTASLAMLCLMVSTTGASVPKLLILEDFVDYFG